MLTKTAMRHAEQPFERTYASEPLTLEQCARLMHCSRERVRQIEVEALAKLSAELHRRGYAIEDLLSEDRPAAGLPARSIRTHE